jgi:hypothetical protein
MLDAQAQKIREKEKGMERNGMMGRQKKTEIGWHGIIEGSEKGKGMAWIEKRRRRRYKGRQKRSCREEVKSG